MIAGADSSGYHPTLAQLQTAYQQGVRVWGFYLPGPGIYSGHTKADFDRIHQAGMKSIGWASGWADPAQQKALAAAWGVDYPTLDDEPGIRPFGPWEQPWLDTSGFGLYMPYGKDGSGLLGKRAPWLIMADYLGASPYSDPGATWNGPGPSVPHGWQWAGTVNAYGGIVDRLWLDDFFNLQPQGDDMEYIAKGDGADNHPGGTYYVAPPFKRWIEDATDLANFVAAFGQPKTMKQEVLDRFIELPPVTSAAENFLNTDDIAYIKAHLGGGGQGPSAPVDLAPVISRLDRLIAELHTP